MPDITYGQLAKILESLGFTVHEPNSRVRVYKHAEAGATIILPSFPADDRVYGHHLSDVKMTLDWFGIADAPEFASRLRKATGKLFGMPETTYGRLTKTLRCFGFTVREPQPGALVYEHAETGALIILPKFPDNDRVYWHHLADSRGTLDSFGIASAAEFANRLSISSRARRPK
jgi:predicted RNA binding protein YcfA (HicA-like mRNA interferase family)